MASEHRNDELNDADAHHSHGKDLQATRQIAKESDNEPEPDGETGQPEKRGLWDSFSRAYTEARDGKCKPGANTQRQDPNAKGRDKSKGLMLIAAAAVIMFFVFIAMFSHSTNRPESEARRNTPSLGLPGQLPGQTYRRR